MEVISKTEILTWEEFVEICPKYSNDSNFIYRGQSNGFSKNEFQEWNLTPSYYRNAPQIIKYYSKQGKILCESIRKEDFEKFLSQQLFGNLFNSQYKNYHCVENKKLTEECTAIKLAYLQHYGVPTCLIDFTKNPLYALYFGFSQIGTPSLMSYDTNGNASVYPDISYKNGKEEPICFLSVYQINTDLLQHLFGIKLLEHYDNDLSLFNEYYCELSRVSRFVSVALWLNPLNKLKNSDLLVNLKLQNGCFLLFDNSKDQNVSFEEFLIEYSQKMNITVIEPIIKIFRINYNSIFRKLESDKKSLFKYLNEKKATGAYLFEDFQGIKNDFNFFHH